MSEAPSTSNQWQHYLPNFRPEDANIPLSCFRPSIKHRLSIFLNQELTTLVNELLPDWGGLAEKIGFDGLETNDIGQKYSPGLEVINRWCDRIDLYPTIGNLVRYLFELDRVDILTDLGDAIQKEIVFHRNRHEEFNNAPQPVQDETVSSGGVSNHILTTDDTLDTIATYDAFVCFDFHDIMFIKQMIQLLEIQQGFKLFIPGRNDIVGMNTYELLTRIISERCRHMIVVLSNHYLDSEGCTFQTSYAFSLNPDARLKKIVPIKVAPCQTPEILRFVSECDFVNPEVLQWSWERLIKSIMRPMASYSFVGPREWNSKPPSSQEASPAKVSTSVSSLSVSASSSDRSDSGTLLPSEESGYASGLRSQPESASSLLSLSASTSVPQRKPDSAGQPSTSQKGKGIAHAVKRRIWRKE